METSGLGMRLLLALVCFWAFSPCHGEPLQISSYELKKADGAALWFKGVVVPDMAGDLSFQNNGMITSVSGVGTRFNCLQWDPDKKTLLPPDVIAQMDPSLSEGVVMNWQYNVQMAKTTLARMKSEYERTLKLLASNAVSQRDFESAKEGCLNAATSLDNAQGALMAAKYNLDACNLKAPFSGVVAKVYASPGSLAWKGDPVLGVVMMNPMTVRVRTGEGLSGVLSMDVPISVYPANAMPPLGARLKPGSIPAPQVEVQVNNACRPLSAQPKEAEGLPKVTSVLFAFRLDPSNARSPLAAPSSSIHRDGAGHFVWQASGQRFFELGKGVSPIFAVARKSVVPSASKFVFFPDGVNYTVLLDAADLQERDVVVCGFEGGLRDGGDAYYEQRRWTFEPGETVDVKIESPFKRGSFHVPVAAVRKDAQGNASIMVIAGGAVKTMAVVIDKDAGGWETISGPELRDGVKIAVPQFPEAIPAGGRVVVVGSVPEPFQNYSPAQDAAAENEAASTLCAKLKPLLNGNRFSTGDLEGAIMLIKRKSSIRADNIGE